jgi:hypothetical protein
VRNRKEGGGQTMTHICPITKQRKTLKKIKKKGGRLDWTDANT